MLVKWCMCVVSVKEMRAFNLKTAPVTLGFYKLHVVWVKYFPVAVASMSSPMRI